jgi:hypothetical protein
VVRLADAPLDPRAHVDRIAINENPTRLPPTTTGQLCCSDGPRQRQAG